MKVLVKGNVIARKNICSMKCADFSDLHEKVVADKDTDYDLVLYGDILCDGVLMNGAQVFVSDKVVSLGEK
jgi:hypothetical protein